MILPLLVVLLIGLAMGLFVGAALACMTRPARPAHRPRPADTLARRAKTLPATWDEECPCGTCEAQTEHLVFKDGTEIWSHTFNRN